MNPADINVVVCTGYMMPQKGKFNLSKVHCDLLDLGYNSHLFRWKHVQQIIEEGFDRIHLYIGHSYGVSTGFFVLDYMVNTVCDYFVSIDGVYREEWAKPMLGSLSQSHRLKCPPNVRYLSKFTQTEERGEILSGHEIDYNSLLTQKITDQVLDGRHITLPNMPVVRQEIMKILELLRGRA